jgi:hypothetical protein
MTRIPLAALPLTALIAAAWPIPQSDFPWLTDLPAARALAAQHGKPLLVVFR